MKSNKNKKIVKLKEGDVIKYNWMHKDYGRAEFNFCPIFKYGKLKKLLIYPRQQDTDVLYYELECYNQRDFNFQSWQHKGIEIPWAWIYFYCKEHKQLAMNVYAPKNTNVIKFSNMSGLTIIFESDKD